VWGGWGLVVLGGVDCLGMVFSLWGVTVECGSDLRFHVSCGKGPRGGFEELCFLWGGVRLWVRIDCL